MWLVIGIVAVLIVAGVTALIVLSVPNVTVTGINLSVKGNSAGTCSSTLSVPTGSSVYLRSSTNYGLISKFDNSGTNGSACFVTSVVTNSTGWTTVSVITQQIVVCGGGSAAFALTFRTPSGAYYGPLTLEANVNYSATACQLG